MISVVIFAGGPAPSWRRLGPSWRILRWSGAGLRRLGPVLRSPGRSWGVLGRLGASSGRLGKLIGILCPIFDGFYLRKSMPESQKVIKFYWRIKSFWLSGYFKITSLLDATLLVTSF